MEEGWGRRYAEKWIAADKGTQINGGRAQVALENENISTRRLRRPKGVWSKVGTTVRGAIQGRSSNINFYCGPNREGKLFPNSRWPGKVESLQGLSKKGRKLKNYGQKGNARRRVTRHECNDRTDRGKKFVRLRNAARTRAYQGPDGKKERSCEEKDIGL